MISEWELVLAWSVQHDEENEAILAREKLNDLNQRLGKPKPPPVQHEDRLWSRFRFSQNSIDQIAEQVPERLTSNDLNEMKRELAKRESFIDSMASSTVKNSSITHLDDFERSEIKWADPLKSQQKLQDRKIDENSLGYWIETYRTRQQERLQAGEIVTGRLKGILGTLSYFRDWVGAETAIESLNGRLLTKLHSELLQSVSQEKCSPDSAKERLRIVRSFIRWLWEQEILAELPRNIDSNALKIAIPSRTPETMTLDEVSALLKASEGKARLYLLLALNCGMTQKDISDLKQSDVDWKIGSITRKRSKTQKHENVPSGLLHQYCGVDGLEFDPGVVDLHLPIHAALG